MPRVQRRWPRRIRRSSQSRGVSERNPRVSSGCSFWNAAVRPQAHILPRGRRAPRATWITYLEGGSWRSSEGREQPRFLTNATGEAGDVIDAGGGWKNEETMLRTYQQPDAETGRRVVLHQTQRIVCC